MIWKKNNGVMKMIKSIISLFIKKNKFDSNLKHQLLFYIYPSQNGEFTQSRIRTYHNIQKIMLLHCRSKVGANGLKYIFHDRYFTYSQLLLHKHNIDFKMETNDHHLLFLIDKEIQYCLTLNDNEVTNRDSYSIIIQNFLGESQSIEYLKLEKYCAENDIESHQDYFNVLNRETLNHIKPILLKDIKNLTKTHERLFTLCKENTKLIMIILIVLFILFNPLK